MVALSLAIVDICFSFPRIEGSSAKRMESWYLANGEVDLRIEPES